MSIPGGFDEPRQLTADGAVCLAYYDQPDLLHDMLGVRRETACRILERLPDRV